VREIREWPSPRSIFEVRIFHGLASFYMNFIKNSSGICKPILDTMKNKHKYFNWIEEVDKILIVLKENIIGQLILVLLDFGKTFQVRCDASGVVIREVLIQDNNLVSYFNEK
jgi:hypothetical protein